MRIATEKKQISNSFQKISSGLSAWCCCTMIEEEISVTEAPRINRYILSIPLFLQISVQEVRVIAVASDVTTDAGSNYDNNHKCHPESIMIDENLLNRYL